mmetsp:Transcript_14745/g.21062  ORF Transcript_14745/g.21062 Transcript_14745/m.21062 type:complete len:228 (-) Transcript_14745:458-1141(-)
MTTATCNKLKLFQQTISRVVLSFPLVLYVKNSLYSIHTVDDASMEPHLKSGDIVLVRKADFFPYYQRTSRVLIKEPSVREILEEGDMGSLDDERDIERALRLDARVGCSTACTPLTFWASPPLCLPGDIVVFKCPTSFTPVQTHMRRLIALGGQRVRPRNSYNKIESLPFYSIWVESNHKENDVDSCTYGPLSKKLLIGKAELILWPPTRCGKISRIRPNVGKAWWI